MRTPSKQALGGLVALALLGGGYLAAQPVTQNQLSGNECWSAGQGPGGPGSFLCINVARGGTADSALTIAGSFTIGGAAASAAVVSGGNLLITAQPSAATITMQPNPVPDGAVVGFCNVTGVNFVTNVVTAVANSGQTMNTAVTLTTQALGTCAKVQWNQANATWYRVQ